MLPSYKNKDKASRQVELYPELEQAIEKRLDELDAGIIWGTETERWSDSYKKALREATLDKGKIGGSKDEQEDYFKRVIASHPTTFWLEGCAPPTVRDKMREHVLKILLIIDDVDFCCLGY